MKQKWRYWRHYSAVMATPLRLYCVLSERRTNVVLQCSRWSHSENKNAVALLQRFWSLYCVYLSVLHFWKTQNDRVNDAAPTKFSSLQDIWHLRKVTTAVMYIIQKTIYLKFKVRITITKNIYKMNKIFKHISFLRTFSRMSGV